MLRNRPKTWAMFAVVCIAAYLISFIAAPWIFTGISKLSEISDYESTITEEQVQQETEPTTDTEKENTENAENEALFNNIVKIISHAAKYVGIVVSISGIFQFILAFMHEDVERRARSITTIVMGAMLVGSSALFSNIMG